MPNGTSSAGINLGSCQSNPHLSTASAPEDATMLAQRLSSATQQTGANFTDRLVSGASTSYDHKAAVQAQIATFTTQMNNSNTTNQQ
ncbi:hypothetical protein F5Y06DRAFT_115998 [Hypoxylon sp. FL0890]|nr:hypothetical protein F5Y06DRAFT_115998 [Hypoxylon sp. FL0890]